MKYMLDRVELRKQIDKNLWVTVNHEGNGKICLKSHEKRGDIF